MGTAADLYRWAGEHPWFAMLLVLIVVMVIRTGLRSP
jgi:hypothetical protein